MRSKPALECGSSRYRFSRSGGGAMALLALLIVGSCSAYVRMGTTVIGDFVSPDGALDAVLMVHNGGAMEDYSTAIAVVHTRIPLARQLALTLPPDLFVVDDNNGKVPWGDRGQLDVKIRWLSNTQVLVQYPAKAYVYRQKSSSYSVKIQYEPMGP
jgi:hypothetical protein